MKLPLKGDITGMLGPCYVFIHWIRLKFSFQKIVKLEQKFQRISLRTLINVQFWDGQLLVKLFLFLTMKILDYFQHKFILSWNQLLFLVFQDSCYMHTNKILFSHIWCKFYVDQWICSILSVLSPYAYIMVIIAKVLNIIKYLRTIRVQWSDENKDIFYCI